MNAIRKVKGSKGFIGMVFLAIALIGIVIAAIASMSRSSSSGTASEQLKTNVSVMLKQAADFKNGYDRMVVNGITPGMISFDVMPGTGLFDPAPGSQYAVKHIPPATLMAAAAIAQFNYGILGKLPGIGISTKEDYLVSVNLRDLQTCQMINSLLYGDALTATPAMTGGTATSWGGAGAFDDTGSVSVNYVGRAEGCVQAGASTFIYYKVMAEN